MTRYQTFGSRFLAAIIDGIILSFVYSLFVRFIFRFDSSQTNQLLDDSLYYIYSIFSHYKYGQTIGKKITNVKVVSNLDESKLIGLANAIKRDNVGIILSILGFLIYNSPGQFDLSVYMLLFSTVGWGLAEIVSMLFNKKRRAIHDYLANSVVIDLKSSANLQVQTVSTG